MGWSVQWEQQVQSQPLQRSKDSTYRLEVPVWNGEIEEWIAWKTRFHAFITVIRISSAFSGEMDHLQEGVDNGSANKRDIINRGGMTLLSGCKGTELEIMMEHER
ncbi:unnamed protein product [Choristocarpus tenellus]